MHRRSPKMCVWRTDDNHINRFTHVVLQVADGLVAFEARSATYHVFRLHFNPVSVSTIEHVLGQGVLDH